ncbi:MAG: hypothetical protein ACFFCT_02390 [Candidatus Odinarchaeota archaeon]
MQNGTYGAPVPNQLIEFFDQTNNVLIDTDTTDGNGIASINWTISPSFPLGPTLVNATFRGNELLFLSPSTQWILLNIVSSMQIIIDYEIGPFAPGDSFRLAASLFDDTNNPISDSSLIALSGNTVLASSTTNSSGIALFSIQCNLSWASFGENIIRIVHEEDLVNFYARVEESITIDIQQIVTSIYVEDYPNEILLNDTINIDVNLSGNENGISATDIGVYLDGIIFDTLITNAFGNATFYLNIDPKFIPGMYSFQIAYNGTERYTSSLTIIEVNIMSPALLDIEIPEIPIVGSISQITITVLDYFGRPFEGTLITISDATNELNTTLQALYTPPMSHILFPFLAPPGIHNLKVNVENPFITNDTQYLSLLVWSRPVLVLQDSNIVHYASPDQEIIFTIKLTDWSGNCSLRPLRILINGLVTASETTDTDGIASLRIIAPHSEGLYNVSIAYTGNSTLYEIPVKYDYQLTVSRLIPVRLELYNFEVFPPLQEVAIYLKVQCLNGSLLAGIQTKFIWLSNEISVLSQQGGSIVLHLPVPLESGNYSLYYEVESGHGLFYSSGFIEIPILIADILASQGIGIGGFALSIILSLTIITIPVIRQRYLTR